MKKIKGITIFINLQQFNISDGLKCRNMLVEGITEKLSNDNNGEFLSAGWYEGTGDICFDEISNVVKAEKDVLEVFNEHNLMGILIRMDNHVIHYDEPTIISNVVN